MSSNMMKTCHKSSLLVLVLLSLGILQKKQKKTEMHDISFDWFSMDAINVIITDAINPFKMEIRLVYTERKVCKDRKNHELQS